ncbi:MAG: T9SS type A sorting domain-containing protein [Flavobacterium sp.]|nr:T9SS type A sorting domain-containing protein [Flavobacterium sp.]
MSIVAGSSHSIAKKNNETFWAWGFNDYGQLGDGTFTSKNNPTQITNGISWLSIKASYHTIALKTDYSLWSWGGGYYGQLGNGNNINKNIPQSVNCPNLDIMSIELLDDSFSIYPNPTKDFLNINNSKKIQISKIIIYDLLGQIISIKNIYENVNIQGLKSGMYIIEILSEGISKKIKFIKE